MPDDSVIDGEVVALDPHGRPSFNTLQNYGSAGAPLHFFIFDLLVLRGRDVMREPLMKRRELIEEHVLPKLSEPIRYSPVLNATLSDLFHSVKEQGLEGLVSKRRDSKYEPGLRSGAWMKMRVNRGSGTRHRGIHAIFEEFRCPGHWVLRRKQVDVRRPNPEWLHAGIARRIIQEDQTSEDSAMSVREPAREEGRPMGCRTDGSQDGRMSVAEAPARRSVRVRRMDG
jgi:hypothetical protein